MSRKIPLVLVTFISILVIYNFLGRYLLHPNDYLIAHGGDAMVIYFDMVYHICQNNEYVHFYGMNYPYGESLILTDAQAALSISLKIIHENIIPICEIVPGIIHSFNLLLIPLTSVFLYLILVKLKIKTAPAVLFSLLIAFLSPQLMRITGHFGLAYPFFIPMVIYWFLIKYENISFKWTDLIFGFTVFFFFINNPYVGFAGAGLFFTAAVLVLIFERNRKAVLLVAAGLIPILLGYIVVKMSDPFQDRIDGQWGFFFYYASIAGMFFPKGSFLYDLLQPQKMFGDVRFEGMINVGIVTTLTIATTLITFLIYKIKRKKWNLAVPTAFKYIFWSSFIIFLYAANYSIYGFAREFMQAHMGPLLMFKASGRLAWTFYYGLTILAVVILHYFAENKFTSGLYSRIFFAAIGIIWAAEDYSFLKNRYGSDIYYENIYKDKSLKNQLTGLGISKEAYEAMYLLPVIQTWNDKLIFLLDYHTQRSSQVMAAMTGIPLINGMMSRAPMESSLSAIQLTAHPVIPRVRIDQMNPDKAYLLVHGNQKQKLTIGENYLLDKGEFVGEFLESKIYRIQIEDFAEMLPPSVANPGPYVHFSSGDLDSTYLHLTSPAALHFQGGLQTLYDDNLPQAIVEKEDSLMISLWYYNDHRFWEVPKLHITSDSNKTTFFNRSSYDYIGYWVRQEIIIPNTKNLKIESEYNHEVFYDDLHIQPIRDSTVIYIDGNQVWNNYPIVKSRFILHE